MVSLMRITSVTYERLSKQRVASYENERASCTVQIDEGESLEEAMNNAKYEVEKALGLLPSKDEVKNAKRILKRLPNKKRRKFLDDVGDYDSGDSSWYDDDLDDTFNHGDFC